MNEETNYDKLADDLIAKKLIEFKVAEIAMLKSKINHLKKDFEMRKTDIENDIEAVKKLDHVPML